jgi:hypothetical protein
VPQCSTTLVTGVSIVASGRPAVDDDDDDDGSEEQPAVTAMARTIAHSLALADSNVLARFAVPALRAFLAADRGDVLLSLLTFTEGTILGVLRQKPRTRAITAGYFTRTKVG